MTILLDEWIRDFLGHSFFKKICVFVLIFFKNQKHFGVRNRPVFYSVLNIKTSIFFGLKIKIKFYESQDKMRCCERVFCIK